MTMTVVVVVMMIMVVVMMMMMMTTMMIMVVVVMMIIITVMVLGAGSDGELSIRFWNRRIRQWFSDSGDGGCEFVILI